MATTDILRHPDELHVQWRPGRPVYYSVRSALEDDGYAVGGRSDARTDAVGGYTHS